MSAILTDANYFGANIQTLRHFHGYDVKTVAKKINVTDDRYRHWEHERAYPSKPCLYAELCKLYKYFDLYALFTKKLTDADLHAHYDALHDSGGKLPSALDLAAVHSVESEEKKECEA